MTYDLMLLTLSKLKHQACDLSASQDLNFHFPCQISTKPSITGWENAFSSQA